MEELAGLSGNRRKSAMANDFKVICSGCSYRTSWLTRQQAIAEAAKHTEETNHPVEVQDPPFSESN
jgi:hypothetical protein